LNQPEIVDVFRSMGFSVLLLHQIGDGCPDILIGKFKKNWLVEIKDGRRIPSQKRLTEDEKDFHEKWRGVVFVIESVEQAIALAKKLGELYGT